LQFAHAFLDIAPYGNATPYGFGSGDDNDLHPGCLHPPLGLLLNGQPFSAVFNVLLIMFGLLFGWFFPVLFLLPSIHAVVAVHMRREDQTPRTGGRHRAARPATVVDTVGNVVSRRQQNGRDRDYSLVPGHATHRRQLRIGARFVPAVAAGQDTPFILCGVRRVGDAQEQWRP
jgi:hypothetical protein